MTMVKARSQVLRLYHGEIEGGFLADWLNDNVGSGEYKRLTRLIENIKWMQRAVISTKGPSWWSPPPDYILVSIGEWAKRKKELDKQFARYRARPMLIMNVEVAPGATPFKRKRKMGITRFQWSLGNAPHEAAALAALHLAEDNLLDRVRQCLRCSKWFYARVRHQRNCSTVCQQSYYRSAEEWKAHRREYMRRYRQLQESTNVK